MPLSNHLVLTEFLKPLIFYQVNFAVFLLGTSDLDVWYLLQFFLSFRSGRWVSCFSKPGIVLKDCQQFGFNYVHHLLTHPVDLSLAKVPKHSDIFLINGDKQTGRLLLISETMEFTYCHPDCSSVLCTLGNLHLLSKWLIFIVTLRFLWKWNVFTPSCTHDF